MSADEGSPGARGGAGAAASGRTVDDSHPGYLEVGPAPVPPRTVLAASPSKSATHRAILLGALTPHTVIEDPLLSNDTIASLRMAICLGARVTLEPTTETGRRMLGTLTPDGLQEFEACEPAWHERTAEDGDRDVPQTWEGLDLSRFIAPRPLRVPRAFFAARARLHVERYAHRPEPRVEAVDLENSGTTLRIGTAIAGLGTHPLRITGDDSLRTRPMAPLADALQQLGVHVETEGDEGRAPVTVRGPLHAGTTSIRGDVSSQYISALLIAAQRAEGPVTIELTTPLKSQPYVDITRTMIETFGGRVDMEPNAASRGTGTTTGAGGPTFRVAGPVDLACTRYTVPGDHSSAAFPLVAAALTGGSIPLVGLDPEDPQGDKAVLEVLERAGCTLTWEPDPEHHGGHVLTLDAPEGSLQPFEWSFRDTPDLFPALAALAARCDGKSRLFDAQHVRLKESDRVAAMADGLGRLGLRVDATDDGLVIHGDPALQLPKALIETHDDHRILMAFACLALVGPGPVWLTHPAAYHVSYPRFRADLDLLGGETRIVEPEDVHALLDDGPSVVTRDK